MFDYISNLWVVVVIMIVFNDQLTIASIPRHFWGSYVPFHPVLGKVTIDDYKAHTCNIALC